MCRAGSCAEGLAKGCVPGAKPKELRSLTLDVESFGTTAQGLLEGAELPPMMTNGIQWLKTEMLPNSMRILSNATSWVFEDLEYDLLIIVSKIEDDTSSGIHAYTVHMEQHV